MLLELFLALFLGILCGAFTGLFPGIHFNLISIMLVSVSSYLLVYTTPLILATFIVAMAITHTALDAIPSIFLGAPDEDSVMSVLPGHRLLMKGHGYAAAVYVTYGNLIALILMMVLTPLFVFMLPVVYPYLQKIMGIVLIAIVLMMVLLEKKKKILALLTFILAGLLGIATINLPLQEPLLPLLTGLFGASGLLASIHQKTIIPPQKIPHISDIKLNKKSLFKAISASLIASPITAFLPGLGASQAAVIGKIAMNITDEKEFLFLIGIINTLVMGLSFVTLYVIQKTRTGAAVAVSQLLPDINLSNLTFLMGVMLVTGIIAAAIAIKSAKYCAEKINAFDYKKISYSVFLILIAVVFNFSDATMQGKILGLMIFITATAL
ncbi:MAG: tripartite tricarboxylate transporter permease, partial [Nanoarchaeota archaeon]